MSRISYVVVGTMAMFEVIIPSKAFKVAANGRG
jgi:hypothetical protein